MRAGSARFPCRGRKGRARPRHRPARRVAAGPTCSGIVPEARLSAARHVALFVIASASSARSGTPCTPKPTPRGEPYSRFWSRSGPAGGNSRSRGVLWLVRHVSGEGRIARLRLATLGPRSPPAISGPKPAQLIRALGDGGPSDDSAWLDTRGVRPRVSHLPPSERRGPVV